MKRTPDERMPAESVSAPQTEIEYSRSLAAMARNIGSAGQVAADWLQVVQEVAGVGIWDWRIGHVGAICTESNRLLYGLARATVMPPHEQWLALIHPDDRVRVCSELDSAVTGITRYQTEFRVLWPDGSVHWLAGKSQVVLDPTGKPVRLIGVNYDITPLKEAEQASREAAEERIHQARHDPLTGLPNRRFLDDHLTQAIDHASRSSRILAVMHIDLDGFKVVNDTLGHSVGDELLRAVSARLRPCISAGDILARTGGDEFTVVLTDIPERRAAGDVAETILQVFQRRFRIGRQKLYVTASVGIGIFPDDGRDPGALKQNADVAMYCSKRLAKNSFQFFTAGMMEPLRERLLLETALRGALENHQLSIQYQAIFRFAGPNSELVAAGCEALLRWRHPQLGQISPARFIPIAEDTGLIIPIGRWVLERVCREIRHLSDTGSLRGRIYVNVSGLQFVLEDFVSMVAGILESTGIVGAQLGIEITESVLMSDFEVCSRKVRELQAFGVSVSVDDFGTGYSCLQYLQRIPIDVLKIDGSFVREVGVSPTATPLIQGIVSLAHSLSMRVIAEGVETAEQLAAVQRTGCDEVQGYLLARPADGALPAAAYR